MLRVEGLNVHYGGIHALKNVSIHVPEEKIVTLVGANGAGKSTLLRTVCGLVPATSGVIRYLGRPITGIASHRIAQEGIAMAPEGRRVFVNLSVHENLLMGAYSRSETKDIERDIEWIFEIFPRLLERRDQHAGTLSGGEQQMLALGRALMSRPKLLLLDEPSLGLAPLLIREVFRVITKIHEEGTTILLIEQNAMAALNVADYGYVLETGEIVLEGTGQDLLNDERVKKAYLGESRRFRPGIRLSSFGLLVRMRRKEVKEKAGRWPCLSLFSNVLSFLLKSPAKPARPVRPRPSKSIVTWLGNSYIYFIRGFLTSSTDRSDRCQRIANVIRDRLTNVRTLPVLSQFK